MPDWTAILSTQRRPGRLAGLGLVTVLLVAALAGPANSASRSVAGSSVTGVEAGTSSQWTARPPLRHVRGGLGVATAGQQILAIGGFDGFDEGDTLDVVEARMVSGSGRWRDLAPLPTARANLATAEVGGLVYAIGGIDNVDTSNVVETFDPRLGRWATSRPLPQPRDGAGAAGLGGLLYVAGGFVIPDGVTSSVVAGVTWLASP